MYTVGLNSSELHCALEPRNSLYFKLQTQALGCISLNFAIAWNLSSDPEDQRPDLVFIPERDWGRRTIEGSPEVKWAEQPTQGKAQTNSSLLRIYSSCSRVHSLFCLTENLIMI